MKVFILIITLNAGMASEDIKMVEGFESEENCFKAGLKITKDLTNKSTFKCIDIKR